MLTNIFLQMLIVLPATTIFTCKNDNHLHRSEAPKKNLNLQR
jgi:hypothetical protein